MRNQWTQDLPATTRLGAHIEYVIIDNDGIEAVVGTFGSVTANLAFGSFKENGAVAAIDSAMSAIRRWACVPPPPWRSFGFDVC